MSNCILIPAYNAKKTVRAVVAECCEHGLTVVVVDDGSIDDTSESLAGLPITLLRHQTNLGKGRALRTGFEWAIGHGYSGIVTLDADGQHDVSAVPILISSALQSNVSLMIASRFAQFEKMAGLRKFWNRFGVWCIRQRTGFDITDSQSGFRYYSSDMLKKLQLCSSGYNMEMEVLVKAWKTGFKITSIPIAARVADGRSTSHYRPFRDTVAISMTFLRYM